MDRSAMSKKEEVKQLQSTKRSNESDGNKNTGSIKRRHVLRSIGAASGVGVSFGFGSSRAFAESKTTVPSDEREKNIIDTALSSHEVQSLINHYEIIHTINRDEAVAVEVSHDDEQISVARIPFDANQEMLSEGIEKIENPYILWSDNETIETIAAYIAYDKQGNQQAVNYHPPSKSTKVERGDISENRTSLAETNNESAQPQMVSPPCGYTEYPNWSCIERTVKNNEGISKSCSTCAAALYTGVNPGSVVACMWCTWDLYRDGISAPGCDLCTESV